MNYHLVVNPPHEVDVKGLQSMARWCYEVKASMDQGIRDLRVHGENYKYDDDYDVADDNVDDCVDHLHPLHPGLPLQIGVKLLLNVSQNWSPAAPE